MNEQLTRLEGQFQAAEAAVDASNAGLRRASAERLATLLERPAKERLAALADAALTPFDREQLERSIEAELPRHHARRLSISVVKSSWAKRFVRHHRRGLIATAISVAPIAWFGPSAVLATPPNPIPIQFNKPLTIDWTLPDGSPLREDAPKGSLGWMNSRGQQGWLRKWFPHAGYGVTGPMPEELLTQGIITRRPQTLSAVPPRSFTN